MITLDKLIERSIKQPVRGTIENSESTWQTFYAIWKAVGQFIEKQLSQGQGVYFPKFAAFSFKVDKTNSNWRKDNFEKKPYLLVHRRFVSDNSVKCGKNVEESDATSLSMHDTKPYVPLISLNPNTIAYASAQPQQAVKMVIENVLDAFEDYVKMAYDVELDFGAAVLRVKNRTIVCEFKQSFLSNLDKSFKPTTHQVQAFGQPSKQKLSEYWNERNAKIKPGDALPDNKFNTQFLNTVDRSALLGVRKK